MRKPIIALFALAISLLFGTQCWAASCSDDETGSCTNTFSPTDTTGTYEFFNNGHLVVHFETVLTSFSLIVSINHTIDPIDPNEFPAGTVCVKYEFNSVQCVQYDFSGFSGGPNGVPVKNVDYKGLITLTLSYDTSQVVHNPAFGHAPGDITTFTEDILTSYSVVGPPSDPTMGGKTPGLSSVIALDEPSTDPATFCSLTLTPTNNASGQKPQVEATLKIASGSCSGTGLRDKTARLSVSTIDNNGNVVFPPLKKVEANKFHWDNKAGLNEYDISTEDLPDGRYTVSVFSSRFSPQSKDFCMASGSVVTCP